jgi:hypothetical protein
MLRHLTSLRPGRRLVVLALTAFVTLMSAASLALAHTTSLTIDRDATLSPGGTVITVTGTLTCIAGENYQVSVRVFQGRGANQEQAFGSSAFGTLCTGSPQLWEVEAVSSTGAFREGKADASATSFTFGVDGSHSKSVGRTIYLSSS